MCYEREPDLREVLNQAKQARAAANIPIQPVVPMLLLPSDITVFTTVTDLNRQHQQHFDQTVAKQQSSLPDSEQCKQAKTPPQSDHEDAPIRERTWLEGCGDRECGRSRARSKDDRQQELDRVHSKSRKCSKSKKCSKSRICSKSRRRSKSRACNKHGVWKLGVWSSCWE